MHNGGHLNREDVLLCVQRRVFVLVFGFCHASLIRLIAFVPPRGLRQKLMPTLPLSLCLSLSLSLSDEPSHEKSHCKHLQRELYTFHSASSRGGSAAGRSAALDPRARKYLSACAVSSTRSSWVLHRPTTCGLHCPFAAAVATKTSVFGKKLLALA